MVTASHGSGLADRIAEQLARHGVCGQIVLDGATVRLEGRGQSATLDPKDIEIWAQLGPDEQKRILDRVVWELSRSHRRVASTKQVTLSAWVEWLRPLAVLAMTGAGLWAAWHWFGKPARQALAEVESSPMGRQQPRNLDSGSGAPAAVDSPADRCRRVQARIATGGTVSALDVDGWLVEMMFLGADAALGPTSPQWNAFLAAVPDQPDGQTAGAATVRVNAEGEARRLVWTEDPELHELSGPETIAVMGAEPFVDVISGIKGGVRIVWSGKFVAMYFDPAGRIRLHRLAAAMYEGSGASFGAVYARCATDTTHQIGTWFRGKDLIAAASGMVVAMGLLVDNSHDANPSERRRAWDRLFERAKRFDRQRFNLTLAEDGVLIAARPGHWATLTFPYQDANRATRSSMRLTRALGLAPN